MIDILCHVDLLFSFMQRPAEPQNNMSPIATFALISQGKLGLRLMLKREDMTGNPSATTNYRNCITQKLPDPE